MPKSFPSKYPDTVCVDCGKTIALGAMIEFARQGSKEKRHSGGCPGAPPADPAFQHASVPAPGRPDASTGSYGGSEAIYVYHRTVKIWSQGVQVGEVMEGVSARGRPLAAVERAEVDAACQQQVDRDEFGRRRK